MQVDPRPRPRAGDRRPGQTPHTFDANAFATDGGANASWKFEAAKATIADVQLHKNAKIELIKKVPLFSRCTKTELAALAAEADELTVPEGRTLARQGASGREFIVIVEGTAEVTKEGQPINRLGNGDFLGEIALVSGAPRTATVVTTSKARLLVLTDRAFSRVVKEMPSVQGSILKALSERLEADALGGLPPSPTGYVKQRTSNR